MSLLDDTSVEALVVEDDPDYAALLARTLQDAGYNVRTALDGEFAMAEVCRQRPDVITLDLQMPHKSGTLFYRQLRSIDQFRDIPVVIVTGITRDDREMQVFIQTLLEVEHAPVPNAYLEKPIETMEFLKVVETATRRGYRMAAAAPSQSATAENLHARQVFSRRRSPDLGQ